jgi:hypothetical protein
LCDFSLAQLQWSVSCGALLSVPLSCSAARAGGLPLECVHVHFRDGWRADKMLRWVGSLARLSAGR